jgi:regulator of PEP synthase PpsR (kinase-PPPase family)
MTIIEKKKNPVVFAVSDSIGETAELGNKGCSNTI